MATDLPIDHEERIRADWIDYNGHLNEAFYVLVFSHATDALIDWIGMDAAYRDAHDLSVYTLETHVIYQLEVKEGARVSVRTRLLDLDDKRVHLFHEMIRPGGEIACVAEMVMACVDMRGPKTAQFPPEVMARLERVWERDVSLALPELAGRRMGLRRGRRSSP